MQIIQYHGCTISNCIRIQSELQQAELLFILECKYFKNNMVVTNVFNIMIKLSIYLTITFKV